MIYIFFFLLKNISKKGPGATAAPTMGPGLRRAPRRLGVGPSMLRPDDGDAVSPHTAPRSPPGAGSGLVQRRGAHSRDPGPPRGPVLVFTSVLEGLRPFHTNQWWTR